MIGPTGQLIPAPPLAPGAPISVQVDISPTAPLGRSSLNVPPSASGADEGEVGESAQGEDEFDDMENSLSLAAIEAELKPKVLGTFDNIADAYKRLRRLQNQDVERKLKNTTLSPAQERRYKKLKKDIINEVKSLRLRQTRIGSLVEQLYDINKRLVGYEGKLMRLAETHGVLRARISSRITRAQSLIRVGSTVSRNFPLGAGGTWLPETRTRSSSAATTFRCLQAKPGSRSASCVRSCTWCKRVNVKRTKRRKKW